MIIKFSLYDYETYIIIEIKLKSEQRSEDIKNAPSIFRIYYSPFFNFERIKAVRMQKPFKMRG